MTRLTRQLNERAERWVRLRFAFPVVVALAATLLMVSEITYRNTTETLRGGIALTDARLQTTRLLQLLADAETAQFAYLVTGAPARLADYRRARAEVPPALASVETFFTTLGADGAAAARRVSAATAGTLAEFDRTLALAQGGERERAADEARRGTGLTDARTAREVLLAQLTQAAELQQAARVSIFDALASNRIAVGVLTLVAVLALFLFLRQLHAHDRERAAQRAALLAERAQLETEVLRRTERLAELARHLQSVREDERARLARELHDELGSLLTASKLDLARTRAKVGEPGEVLVRLDRLNENLNKGIALKRRIIEDLRPSALSNFGLAAALQILSDEMGRSLDIPVRLSATPCHLPPESELAVYRFVQEALTNIGKYARASAVDVTLRVIDDHAIAEVRDNGIGFDPSHRSVGRHGLAGMQFRAESLGGTMRVQSAPGAGTTVRIDFPQSPPDALAA